MSAASGVGCREQGGGAGVAVGAPAAPGLVGPADDGVQLVRLLVGGLPEWLARCRIEDGEAFADGAGRRLTGLTCRHAAVNSRW